MALSEQLRQLAVHLASLASLEDVVTHGLQSLQKSPSGLVAPISSVEQVLPAALLRPRSRSRSPLAKAAPNRPRGSLLLSQVRTLVCKTDNFVPRVVPRLSTNSGSISSSTSPPQNSSSSSSSPALERSDGTAPRKWCKSTPKTQNSKLKKKRSGNRDSDDRLREFPEWLEEFTDNLADTELPASAHSSQDSASERPPKVVSKSRKHSIYSPFPKDRNYDVCLRNKGSLQRTEWQSSTSGRKVW